MEISCTCPCGDCRDGRHCGDIYYLIEPAGGEELDGRCNEPSYFLTVLDTEDTEITEILFFPM
jgi:hypothetical protein